MSDDDVAISVSELKPISQIFFVFIISVSFNNSTTGNLKKICAHMLHTAKVYECKIVYRER